MTEHVFKDGSKYCEGCGMTKSEAAFAKCDLSNATPPAAAGTPPAERELGRKLMAEFVKDSMRLDVIEQYVSGIHVRSHKGAGQVFYLERHDDHTQSREYTVRGTTLREAIDKLPEASKPVAAPPSAGAGTPRDPKDELRRWWRRHPEAYNIRKHEWDELDALIRADERTKLAAVPPTPVVTPSCEWKFDKDDCFWTTACGATWVFTDSGSLEDHSFHFCHQCGKPVKVAAPASPAGQEGA